MTKRLYRQTNWKRCLKIISTFFREIKSGKPPSGLIWAAESGVARLPYSLRYAAIQSLAATVYFPLARTAKLSEKLGTNVESFPLSQYRNRSFYVMRNDALDRFGTQLEKRFTKAEIRTMMEEVGLKDIIFSETSFWTAIGFKK